jgi:hypothetical protein
MMRLHAPNLSGEWGTCRAGRGRVRAHADDPIYIGHTCDRPSGESKSASIMPLYVWNSEWPRAEAGMGRHQRNYTLNHNPYLEHVGYSGYCGILLANAAVLHATYKLKCDWCWIGGWSTHSILSSQKLGVFIRMPMLVVNKRLHI